MFGISDGTLIFLVLTSILIALPLHEAMHAYMSNYLGDDTAVRHGRLTINPLAHIDPINTVAIPILLALSGLPPFGAAKPVPFNPARVRYGEWGAALVGLAGPATNLFLGLFSGLWLRFVIGFDEGIITDFFLIFTSVNISFFAFNMIPFPPLDGSRVIYALVPESGREIMRNIEAMGMGAIVGFMFIFYFFLAPIFGDVVNSILRLILGL